MRMTIRQIVLLVLLAAINFAAATTLPLPFSPPARVGAWPRRGGTFWRVRTGKMVLAFITASNIHRRP